MFIKLAKLKDLVISTSKNLSRNVDYKKEGCDGDQIWNTFW